MRDEAASMKDSIRLTNINVPKHLDQNPKPAAVAKVSTQPSVSGPTPQTAAIAVTDEEKDKKLEEALADKQKLLGLLGRVKKTFDRFKNRHTDLVAGQQSGSRPQGMTMDGNSAGESGCTDRSHNITADIPEESGAQIPRSDFAAARD